MPCRKAGACFVSSSSEHKAPLKALVQQKEQLMGYKVLLFHVCIQQWCFCYLSFLTQQYYWVYTHSRDCTSLVCMTTAVVWFGDFSLCRYTLFCFTLSEFKVELKICWKRYTGWGRGNNFPITYDLLLPFSLITTPDVAKWNLELKNVDVAVCSSTSLLKAIYLSEVRMPTSGQIPRWEEIGYSS